MRTPTMLYRGEYVEHDGRRLDAGQSFDAGALVWFTADELGARGYLRGRPGHLYRVAVDGGEVADEESLRRAARRQGIDPDECDVHELVDRDDIVQDLAARGYIGAEYGETDPVGRPIYTVVLFDGARARVVSVIDIH